MVILALPSNILLILNMDNEIGKKVILDHSFFGILFIAKR